MRRGRHRSCRCDRGVLSDFGREKLGGAYRSAAPMSTTLPYDADAIAYAEQFVPGAAKLLTAAQVHANA